MNQLYIIPPQYLPVPAVKGGAVETLIELFLKENEIEKKFNIICFSTLDKRAAKIAQEYKYTKFIYIDNFHWMAQIKYQFSRIPNKLFRIRPYSLDMFHGFIYRYIKKRLNNQDFIPDAILVEGGSNINEFKKISKLLDSEKMFLHVHRNLTVNHYDFNKQEASDIFNHLISVSSYTENTWNKSKKFHDSVVVPNSIDITAYNKLTVDEIGTLRSSLGYSEKDFVVLFCGRLTEVKGIRELIKAVKEIDEDNIKLLILGSSNFEGAKLTPFQKEIKELAVSTGKRITFTGFIPNADVNKYYSISQVVVIPSIYEDPFPLVKIEAMASGKPLIITNSGGVPECVPEGGRIVVNKDNLDFVNKLSTSILDLFNDPTRVKKMGEINLNYSKLFSRETYYNSISVVLCRND